MSNQPVKKKSLKVLCITRKWPPAVGGMETFIRELTLELTKQVDLDILALPGREGGRPPSPPQLLLFLIKATWRLWRDRTQYDLIHFGDFVLFPLAWLHALWAPSISRVLTVYGLDLVYGNRSGIAPGIYRFFVAWAGKRSQAIDTFIAISRYTETIARRTGCHHVVTVPLGVRLPTQTRPKTFPTSNNRYILYVGRIVRRKGALWFAQEVLPLLPEDVKLYVVGQIWDKKEGEKLKKIPRVQMFGYVEDQELLTLRDEAHSVIMPNIPSDDETDVEGFGLVSLEAAVEGSVVVASALEGITDAVRDGETGFLARPKDAQHWASILGKILEWDTNTRQQFIEKAYLSIKEHYSWSRVANDTLDVFESCYVKKKLVDR